MSYQTSTIPGMLPDAFAYTRLISCTPLVEMYNWKESQGPGEAELHKSRSGGGISPAIRILECFRNPIKASMTAIWLFGRGSLVALGPVDKGYLVND